MELEILELRCLPTVTISGYDPVAGQVSFTGDFANDNLVLSISSGFVQHNIVGGGLNSSIDMDPATPGDQTLLAGVGICPLISVNLGSGNDILTLDESTWSYNHPISYIGGSNVDTLSGSGVFNITGANVGTLATVSFSSIESLSGQSGNDVFAFFSSGRVTGSLDGGTGTNTLDYSALVTSTRINLTTQKASWVLVNVLNFQNVTGSMGSDIVTGGSGVNVFTGNGGADVLAGMDGDDTLSGGDGNDILIGGNGADSLDGGNDDDMLIGCSTNYDNNASALNALLVEWRRTDIDTTTKFDHELNGGGLNGSVTLSGQMTADSDANVLTGGVGVDAFVLNSGDTTDASSEPTFAF